MNVVGVPLFAKHPDGRYLSSIATLFPLHNLVINTPPMHVLQVGQAFPAWFEAQQRLAGKPEPRKQKLNWECRESVALIIEPGDVVLIRPELERMDLALEADEILQREFGVPKHRIRFLSVNVPRVRQVLRERGELWRISTPPSKPAEMKATIASRRVAIGQQPIYFHSPFTGTRWLTFAAFAGLGALNDVELANQLDEIVRYAAEVNRTGHPEVDFFGTNTRLFGSPLFVGLEAKRLPPEELRRRYAALCERFRVATRHGLAQDNLQDDGWCQAMFETLTASPRDDETSEVLLDPGAEQWLKVRWLPGGRFQGQEFIFDSVFTQIAAAPEDPLLEPLQDSLARGFIANLIREYGDLEYLNLGRVEAAETTPPPHGARRGVYLAEVKARDERAPRLLFLRVQRWGIRERLLEKDERGNLKDLVRAVFETEEYVDYTLDCRLGCQQLGMHLPARVHMRRVTEPYDGALEAHRDRFFPVFYYEREYFPGTPSNRIPEEKLLDAAYARAFARLLGQAAALNIIVGRTLPPEPETAPGVVLFDEGNEIVVEGSDGLPFEIVLVDHGGTFADFHTSDLRVFAEAYAAPISARWGLVQDPQEFTDLYLGAFFSEFEGLQQEYRRLPEAFDNLFKHLPDRPRSFAHRWRRVLDRMNHTDVPSLIEAIRERIRWSGGPGRPLRRETDTPPSTPSEAPSGSGGSPRL